MIKIWKLKKKKIINKEIDDFNIFFFLCFIVIKRNNLIKRKIIFNYFIIKWQNIIM